MLRDVHLASQQWRQRFPDEVINAHPAVAAIVNAYQAARDHNTGNFAGALDRFNLAWEAALETGQTLTAVVAAVNAGGTYVGLNDHEAALEWLQRGLELARANGWAVTLGPCLRQMGEVMRATQVDSKSPSRCWTRHWWPTNRCATPVISPREDRPGRPGPAARRLCKSV